MLFTQSVKHHRPVTCVLQQVSVTAVCVHTEPAEQFYCSLVKQRGNYCSHCSVYNSRTEEYVTTLTEVKQRENKRGVSNFPLLGVQVFRDVQMWTRAATNDYSDIRLIVDY